MDERKLKAKCIEKGFSIAELAIAIGMAPSTFYKKMINKSFTIKEVNLIIDYLDLKGDEVLSIFFDNCVA